MKPINEVHACAIKAAEYSTLRKLRPLFSVSMHDEIMSRLVYMDIMKPSWEALHKAAHKRGRPPAQVAYGFLYASLDAYMAYAASNVRPISEHRDYYHQIAETVRALVSQVNSDPEFGWGHSGSLLDQPSHHNEQMIEDLAAFAKRQGVDESVALEIATAGKDYAYMHGEPLQKRLDELAQLAENIANAGPLSTRPNAQGAHQRYFVRVTTKWLLQELDRPLYAVSASAANALFCSDIDPYRVKSLVRRD